MKKALFFMIFIFATAVCGYAQEAPAAEQNDDKTLDSRHQNRRTMRGYKAFYDVEYGFDIDDEEKDWEGGYIAGYPHCNNFMISTTQGYQFNNFFFLGGGLGLLRYIDGKKTMMPIFAETSINLLQQASYAVSSSSFRHGCRRMGRSLLFRDMRSKTEGCTKACSISVADNERPF